MPALHPTTTFNVEATLSQWFITKAATITLPLTVNYSIVTVMPENGIQPPCFSIFHRTVLRSDEFQGRVSDGVSSTVAAANIMQLSWWITRKPNGVFDPNWLARLNAGKAIMEAVFASPGVIRLSDYLSTPASPAAVNYVVRTRALEFFDPGRDPNADIERVSANIPYSWELRTNVV